MAAIRALATAEKPSITMKKAYSFTLSSRPTIRNVPLQWRLPQTCPWNDIAKVAGPSRELRPEDPLFKPSWRYSACAGEVWRKHFKVGHKRGSCSQSKAGYSASALVSKVQTAATLGTPSLTLVAELVADATITRKRLQFVRRGQESGTLIPRAFTHTRVEIDRHQLTVPRNESWIIGLSHVMSQNSPHPRSSRVFNGYTVHASPA